MKRISIVLLSLCLTVLMVDRSAFALEYNYKDLGYVFSGSSSSYATDISNNGQICGTYTDASGTHGYVLDEGTLTSFGVSNAVSFTVNGINDQGQIVGDYWDGSYRSDYSEGSHLFENVYGYVKNGDVYTTIQYSAEYPHVAYQTHATGINDKGQIVGFYDQFLVYPEVDQAWDYSIYEYISNGFVLDGDTFTIFREPELWDSMGYMYAYDINNKGQIVGYYDDDMAPKVPAYIKEGDTYTSFWSGAGEFSGISDMVFWSSVSFQGINDRGQVVGRYNTINGNVQSLIGDGDIFSPISYPDALDTYIQGINDRGWIVGNYYDGTSYHAFVGKPVPEPTTMLLLGTGLLGLAGFRKKIKRNRVKFSKIAN